MKKTIEVFVHQRVAGYSKGEVFISTCDMTKFYEGEDSCRLIAQVEMEVDVPDDDLDLAEIDALESEIVKERGQSQHKINLLLDRIASLKAIGHEVAA